MYNQEWILSVKEFDIFFWEYISKQWTLLKMHFIPSR